MRLDKTTNEAAVNTVVTIQEGVRGWLAVTPNNVEALWERYRSDSNSAVDFLMSTACELQFRAGLTDQAWRNMLVNLADAISIHPAGNRADLKGDLKTSIDDTIMDRVIPADEIMSLLCHNKWLVSVVLLTMIKPVVRVDSAISHTAEED